MPPHLLARFPQLLLEAMAVHSMFVNLRVPSQHIFMEVSPEGLAVVARPPDRQPGGIRVGRIEGMTEDAVITLLQQLSVDWNNGAITTADKDAIWLASTAHSKQVSILFALVAAGTIGE